MPLFYMKRFIVFYREHILVCLTYLVIR